jgi:hypothetical protein
MSACSICGHESHGTRVCPELVLPLRDGFYKPQGGGGGHSHDEDECLRYEVDAAVAASVAAPVAASCASLSAIAFPCEIASLPPVCPNT